MSRLRFPLKSIAASLKIFPYFFITVFGQWPLIYYIIKFNTCTCPYRFLLKVLKIVCDRLIVPCDRSIIFKYVFKIRCSYNDGKC